MREDHFTSTVDAAAKHERDQEDLTAPRANVMDGGFWDDPVQCQGCGRYSTTAKIGDPHPCWLNDDGTYEEGGTYQ